MVQLVEILQSYAVELGNAVHRLSLADDMDTALIALRCFLALLFQIYDVSLVKHVAAVALVITCQRTIGYTDLTGY